MKSDNTNHLLDNQIIVLRSPNKQHCTVNCCDYSYQFAPTVQFNSNQNTSQTNYLTTNQTNPQQTNGQSQQYVSQHYLVKNSDLQNETLT